MIRWIIRKLGLAEQKDVIEIDLVLAEHLLQVRKQIDGIAEFVEDIDARLGRIDRAVKSLALSQAKRDVESCEKESS